MKISSLQFLLGFVLLAQPVAGIILEVDIISGPQSVLDAWGNYTGGGAQVVEDNNPGGALGGNPFTAQQVNFRRVQLDDLNQVPMGFFKVGNLIGADGLPGEVEISADARSINRGGRSGEIILTDVKVESSVATAPGTPLTVRMILTETFGMDKAWLGELALKGNAQWGWSTGIGATIGLSEPGDNVTISTVLPGTSVNGDPGPSLNLFAEQFGEPAGIDFYNPSFGPVVQGGPAPLSTQDTFDVRYVLDFTINSSAGGAANPVIITMGNSLDGVGLGSGFGDQDTPLPPGIPEPSFLFFGVFGLGTLLRRARRKL